jgi:hypothetical protein
MQSLEVPLLMADSTVSRYTFILIGEQIEIRAHNKFVLNQAAPESRQCISREQEEASEVEWAKQMLLDNSSQFVYHMMNFFKYGLGATLQGLTKRFKGKLVGRDQPIFDRQMLKAGKGCLTQDSKISITSYPEPRASPNPPPKRKQLINRPKPFMQVWPMTQRFKVRKGHQRQLSLISMKTSTP